MASNQLSDSNRKELEALMDCLFGRVLKGFPCPLTYRERTTLCRLNLSPAEAEAVENIEDYGVLNEKDFMHVFIDRASGQGHIHLKVWADDAPGNYDNFLGLANKENTDTNRATIESRLGLKVTTGFLKWLDEAQQLGEDIERAKRVFNDIMKMATTAGHLRRMCPELYRLARLKSPSTRASAVPYEWSAYPRRDVDHLTTVIAKLSLLPQQRSAAPVWSCAENYTWPLIPAAAEED